MLQIELIVDPRQLQALRDRWRELAGANIFQWPEWLLSWWDAYGSQHELFVLVARDDIGTIQAIAPWYRQHTLSGGRTIRFLGSGKACSEYLSLLTTEQQWSHAVQGIAEWLLENHQSPTLGWDQLELQATPADDPKMAALAAWMETADAQVAQRSGPGCWRLMLEDDWESQLRKMSQSTRRKVRKLEKQSALFDPPLQPRSSLDYGDWDSWMDRLELLHEKRWKAVQVEGCFSCSRFRHFLRQAGKELAERGNAWIAGIELNGEISAATLLLCREDQHYVYLCGVDPDQHAHEPGWLLNIHILRQLIGNSASYVDFLRGDERYKTDLRSTFIPQTDWRIAAPHASARIRHQLWVTHHWLRDMGKQWWRRTPEPAISQ